MHCLGAGSGGQVSPNGFGSRGSVLSVVRALGVLVCEGRIQGPPRGYKEGPHCVPPLQSAPNNHVCEKDNYLCDRYLVLVREITERVAIGSYLCVEVVLCSDCPCGLVKAKSKHRVLSVPSITSWQHSSEMLLEYWCIGIVPSKSPETMNSQGLYQAVRSRLHFSQVAAWWSRTTGARPSHVATRIVQPSLGDEQLRRFREEPVEHTFPLAGLGDGNSVEVTVWALPRMEDIPRLQCPLHPQQPEDCLVANVVESSAARASTPTGKLISTGPTTSTSPTTTTTTVVPDGVVDGLLMPGKLITKSIAQSSNLHNHHVSFASSNAAVAMPKTMTNNNSSLAAKKQHHQQQQPTFVYYMSSFRSAALLDDRLQIPCDKPGKHHCHCADEEDDVDDVVPATSATVVRPNGERKRRRSLPCRPPDPPTNNGFATSGNNSTPIDHQSLPVVKETSSNITSISTAQNTGGESNGVESLERNFRTQLSIEEQQECCGNLEKRYKRSESTSSTESQKQDGSSQNLDSSSNNTNVPLVIPWISYSANGNTVSAGLPVNQASRNTMNLVLNPFCSERAREKLAAATAEQEKMGKINSKVHHQQTTGKKTTTTTTAVKLDDFKKEKESSTGSKADQSSILDWISRMPGRVLGSNNNNNGELINGKVVNQQPTSRQPKCEVKMRNCNLELSPREFDEVLAVLRARTPLGRRRTALRTAKRREKYDRLVNETTQQQQQQTASKSVQTEVANATVTTDASLYSNVSNKADVLLGAILRSSSKENNIKKAADNSNGTKPKPMLPTKEPIEKSTKTAASSTVTSNSLLESSSTVISPESESSLPSIFNKRLLRLRQLFKLEQDYKLRISEGNECLKKNDFRAKRRIDFSKEERNEDENEDEKKEDDEEEDDENSDILHCDSSIGTSTNSAHVNSIFRSTNNEKCSDCCSPELNAEFIDGQQQHIERYMNGRIITTSGKKKSRSKRNLSPIWVNHNNNHINGKSTNLSENCTTVKEDGTENSQDRTVVPSAKDQERFRRSLENAASMVFHSRTGLPLTSSPAPLRRGSCCFDFDSSLNSVSSKRSALFELNTPPSPGAVSLEENDREMESACDTEEVIRRRSTSRNRPQSHALLGSFEESALNGRLEPVSTVHGFTAEIGASGTFCPKHRKLPVTVFFYTLGDNDKVSSPYLAHINLGKKGYQVPRMGTIQVTLLNPLGTVVKMFVVLYDLSDMPARSHTFLRQRTLRDKTLRYLIHLRFMSGKSGRIYLHTDVRMIICRKSDVDTASDFGSEPPKELRSYIHGPTNPKFSPRC